ncbi:MAG: hypothetical protein COA38_12080 [Fluviicola sp.]|nr:MAG: hypothetical protein COA38_12080 [Fluviicola sp.]
MKFIYTFLLLFLGFNSSAQSFHFDDTVTSLVKTTDESPAHWYLEVLNDVFLDTTLRWKASFGPNLPPQWVITFDDQNNFYNPVNDGDSADFTLYASPAFPQKLIIGATLNNTAATASVYFDIYDPADPSFVQTIEYRFIISMGSGTLNNEEITSPENWFTQSGRTFVFPEEFVSNEIILYDVSGSRIYDATIEANTLVLPSNIETGVFFITMRSANTFYSTRVVLN